MPKLEWVWWGCVLSAMQCHTVTSETLVMLIVHTKILNDDILHGMVLGDIF